MLKLEYFNILSGKVKDDCNPTKWKWTVVKQSGSRPSPRSGLSLAVVPGNRALCFGGVFDEVSYVRLVLVTFLPFSDNKVSLFSILYEMNILLYIDFSLLRMLGVGN